MSQAAAPARTEDLTARLIRRLVPDASVVRLVVLAVLVLIVFSLASPDFLTLINFQSMGLQVTEVGLLSLAIMVSMLTGGIDLSIVSIANVAAIVTAQLFAHHGGDAAGAQQTALYVLAGVAAGTACGLLNGVLIAKLRITPILATLGTMQLLNGLAIAWTGGEAIYGMPDSFLNIGNGYVGSVPIPVLILLGGAVLTAIFVNRTGRGLRIQLLGANQIAAKYSGLRNERVLFATYLASAFLSSLAGIVIAARSASASADYGASYVLLAIVIVVLGGVNPLGGFGTVTGVVLAAFTLQMVNTGFNQVGFNAFLYQIAQGVILIGVLGLNTLSERYGWAPRLAWLTRWRARREPGVPEPPAALAPPVPPADREEDVRGRRV
jgi:simple sugar transport system permease protein